MIRSEEFMRGVVVCVYRKKPQTSCIQDILMESIYLCAHIHGFSLVFVSAHMKYTCMYVYWFTRIVDLSAM
jgi:hypothetical protein